MEKNKLQIFCIENEIQYEALFGYERYKNICEK